jgi:hypothetical protein
MLMPPMRHFAVVLLAAAACGPTAAVVPSADQLAVLSSESAQVASITPDDVQGWPDAAVQISSASITGDTLVLAISHGGGCRTHRYALLVSNAWRESSPVQVGARLAHDDGGDVCKALLSRELRISLAPVREAYIATYGTADRRVSIGLAGAPGMILYTF